MNTLLSNKLETKKENDIIDTELIYDGIQDLRIDVKSMEIDKKVSLFKKNFFTNVDDALSKINTNYHYEYYFKFKNQLIKDTKITNLTSRIFGEKSNSLLFWSEDKHIQMNFLSFALDMIILNLKFWGELLPVKYDDFQQTVDVILENELKPSFWQMSKPFAYLEVNYIANMRNTFKAVNNNIYHHVKIVKEYLIEESVKFKDNVEIINIFELTKNKMKEEIKESFDENLYLNNMKKYFLGNLKSIESSVNVFNRKLNILTSLTYDSKGFKFNA